MSALDANIGLALSDLIPEDHDTPIEDKNDIMQFIKTYDIKDKIPCAIVGCHQPHNRGIIVLLRNGALSRIGGDCGKTLLGVETFVGLQRDLDRRERRALRERFISSPTFDLAG